MKLNDSLVKAYEFLLENIPVAAQEVYEGIEIFKTSLEYGSNAIKQMIRENSDDLSRLSTIIEYAKVIENLQNQVNEYFVDFSMKKMIEEDDIEEELLEEDDSDDKVVNYAECSVNRNIPHTLDESFSHKKICGFKLNNIRYDVNTWKNALIEISELLYKEDNEIFRTFLNSPAFKGRKNKYFTNSSNGSNYYIKLKEADIYVWTNLSANAICKIMKTMLLCYKKSISNFFIYLKADYTILHNVENNIETGKKIGKYVRQVMRNLSLSKYEFSRGMIDKLTNAEETKKMFGIGLPFFKEYTKDRDISFQIKDNKGNSRYWKEVFEFNGKCYLIVSQWQEYHRERFNEWLNNLGK